MDALCGYEIIVRQHWCVCIGVVGMSHILREASALSVLLQWAFQSLYAWDGQQVQTLAHFLFINPYSGGLRGKKILIMKRIIYLFVLILGCTIFCNEAMAAGKKVAVYVEGDMSKSDKSIVNSSVIARLSGNKDYKAFERNTAFVNALNKEQDFQVSGEVPEKEIRAIGERMGVDYVIVVNAVISSDEKCHMSARLIDLVTGEVVKSVSLKREYTGSDVLANMANNIAYRLINKQSK